MDRKIQLAVGIGFALIVGAPLAARGQCNPEELAKLIASGADGRVTNHS